MYEVNKEAFAAFLTQQRKEKGWTQKDLAERLYVSDKAVSKWERGLSLPDISLLIPLADCLGVGVTELLEGRKMEAPMEAENVEMLVKKALRLTEEDPEQERSARRRRTLVFAGAAIVAAVIYLTGIWLLGSRGYGNGSGTLLVFEVLGLIFGLYFWCFMKERLPGYYDENKIGFYADGFLRLNLPGVSFRNDNWPRVVKTLRVWSIVTIVITPLLSILVSLLPLDTEDVLIVQMVLLFVFLGSLFLPIYLAAGDQGKKRKWWIGLLAVAGLLVILLTIPGVPHSSSVLEIGSVSSSTAEQWIQRHSLLSGTKTMTLRPKQKQYVVQVETNGGTLDMEIQDEVGTAFSQTDIQTGDYPIILAGKSEITVRADGHKGSFAILPEG